MQRNLQSFYKAKGYYQAEVLLTADPAQAQRGRVPVTFTVRPHGLFRFDGVTVRNETRAPAAARGLPAETLRALERRGL